MTTIEDIESKLGYHFPKEYIEFLKTSDKKKYNNKEYCRTLLDGYKLGEAIDHFTTLETFWSDNKYRSFLEDFQEQDELPNEYVESKYLYLIASSWDGSICMALNGQHKGKIYNVDNGDFGITFQSNTLNEFLEDLYSSSEYNCEYKELEKAVSENNLIQLKELIEKKDGNLILERSSFCGIGLFDIAYKNDFKIILEYLMSKGFDGFNRIEKYKLKD